ncbi:hypothetical protein EOM57_01030 [Candidatus Saccharibacteria bacterium]|nr:hypothetical protein [Candidatus Saccharibacteria bacterium]
MKDNAPKKLRIVELITKLDIQTLRIEGHDVNAHRRDIALEAHYEEDADTIEQIMVALKKSLPKRPITIEDGAGFGDQVLSCPCCKKPIVNVWDVKAYEPNYCHFCGQALDHEKAIAHAMAARVDMAVKNVPSILLDHTEITKALETGVANALQFSIGSKK